MGPDYEVAERLAISASIPIIPPHNRASVFGSGTASTASAGSPGPGRPAAAMRPFPRRYACARCHHHVRQRQYEFLCDFPIAALSRFGFGIAAAYQDGALALEGLSVE